ncbi:hypothetical protein Srot_0691 [Segniliparus rotundus DSM 44985]|uniref:AtpZ/AtpI family protein n=1 Tax=Segniliparus rotundus (strain ATCC BAA-972 / CDC 1076 / CIP 108378 / DSM 44985 / JCM 13578) TaxID=640132 RepID=D6ZDA9_SEGRD|nr:AtpZ/AtpI family protein [Segniliparus rotundus]ADG97173.1 hypothetical protein Srot_0691 [Segniliparus rotundus DSM 44985]
MAASAPSSRELIGLGASVAGSVILGLAAGFFSDKALGTSPALLFVGLLLGVLGATAVIALRVRRFATADVTAEEQSVSAAPTGSQDAESSQEALS